MFSFLEPKSKFVILCDLTFGKKLVTKVVIKSHFLHFHTH